MHLEDESLVGSGSVVLHHAVVGTGATVGANAVVPNNMEVPAGALALGVPATLRPDRSNPEIIRLAAAEYVSNGQRYRRELAPARLTRGPTAMAHRPIPPRAPGGRIGA